MVVQSASARIAGHPYVTVDGTLIITNRCRSLGPTGGVDLWWSGKHAHEHRRHHAAALVLLHHLHPG